MVDVEQHVTFRVSLIVSIGLSVLAFLVAVGAFIATRVDPEPVWNPLGDYPVQVVTNTIPGYATPAVHVGEDVTVSGTKCNKSKQKVTVVGVARWSSVDPAGFYSPQIPGQAVRLPGCTRTIYTGPIPDEVLARVHSLCDERDLCETVWRKDGRETPIRPNGERGAERIWFTGNFTIIATPGP